MASKSKQAQQKQAQAKASQAKAAAQRAAQANQAQQARVASERRGADQGRRQNGQGRSSALQNDTPAPPPRLRERYRAEVAPALREEFGYSNVMQIPGLSKIVVNMGVGEAARDSKLIDGAVRDLT